MTRMALTRLIVYSGLFVFSIGVSADVLLIQQIQQADRMDLPLNGMSMSEVEAAYGTPGEKQAAIGNPPISRWVYDAWSVYFEYDQVLYTVLHEGVVIEGVSEPLIESLSEPESNP